MNQVSELLRAVGEVRAELASMTAEMARLRSEVVRSREEMAALRLAVQAPEQQSLPFIGRPLPPDEQLVTLDQMAAIVNRKKRALEHYRDQMPAPARKGRRGQAAEWRWADVRPWLEETFSRRLPEEFPGLA